MVIPQVTAELLAGDFPKMPPGVAAEEFVREQPILYEAAKQLAPNEDALAWILIGMTVLYRSLKLQMQQERGLNAEAVPPKQEQSTRA